MACHITCAVFSQRGEVLASYNDEVRLFKIGCITSSQILWQADTRLYSGQVVFNNTSALRDTSDRALFPRLIILLVNMENLDIPLITRDAELAAEHPPLHL